MAPSPPDHPTSRGDMSQLYRTLTGQSQKSHQSRQSSDLSTPAHSTLSRTNTADPLTGTLHHLTPAQEEKLEEFKSRLLKGGWWSPDGVNGKPSHDDGTLLYDDLDLYDHGIGDFALTLFPADIYEPASST